MNGMNNLYYNDKKLKQIKNKRTQKTKRVWGWILTILGALELPAALMALDASALISPLIFLIPIGTIVTRRFFKETGRIYVGSFVIAMLYCLMTVANTMVNGTIFY